MDDFGLLHHVELQVADLATSESAWEWLFDELGYEPHQAWAGGRSWRRGVTYVVLANAPRDGLHDRRLPGLSHLAFRAGTRANVDRLWASAPDNGWSQLYADRYPWAGQQYAAFLEGAERFKVELVATSPDQ